MKASRCNRGSTSSSPKREGVGYISLEVRKGVGLRATSISTNGER
jgi:hypothetical protein